MIRHVLLIRFKATATAKDLSELEAAFMKIPSLIEGVTYVEWGENNSPENKNEGFTHCILMTFADHKARDFYLPHAQHIKLKEIFKPLLDDIIVLDYDV